LQRYSCAKADEEARDAKARQYLYFCTSKALVKQVNCSIAKADEEARDGKAQAMHAAEAQQGVQRQQVLWVRVTGSPFAQFYSIYFDLAVQKYKH